jgi:hypothetical protein
MTPGDAKPREPRRDFYPAAFLFALFIAPAALNLFPLYMEDSAQYAGNPEHLNGLRSIVPGVLALPLYPLLNVWALPVINCAALAAVFLRFFRVFEIEFNYPRVFVLVLSTSIPFYTSFIMPDIWIVVALLCTVMLLVRWRWVDVVLAGVAIAGHGSNSLIFLALLPIALLLFAGRAKVLAAFGSVLLTSFLVLGPANLAVTHSLFPENFSWSIVGSKILNGVPSALDSLCQVKGGDPICVRRNLMDSAANTQHLDDFYIWHSPIGSPEYGGLTREQFNEAGRELLETAIEQHPLALARATLLDFAGFYNLRNDHINAYVSPEYAGKDNMQFILVRDHGLFFDRGWPNKKWLLVVMYLLNNATIGLSVFFGARYFNKLPKLQRQACTLLFCAMVMNDLVFAFLSGPDMRYHLRVLGVFVPVAMMIYSARQKALRPEAG